tara:strand:- start:147 stop:596 length:450 start_codon:yes stop_codon:yes gene_type:complete
MPQNKYMEKALQLANKAKEINEIPVGSVIVNSKGEIIASSYNTNFRDKDPTAHAEINAIRKACALLNSERLKGCDIYVTLEPCIMCAAAISRAKIERLYYGADDLIYGSVNGNINFFQSKNCNHVPEIYDNISKTECESLINNFFKGKR